MKNLKLLDVTLRESIYLPELSLQEDHAFQIVQGLSRYGIDYIEIGYVQEEGNKRNLSTYCPIEYINYLNSAIDPTSKSKLVLMMYPQKYNSSLVKRMHKSNINMVRLCFSLEELKNAIPLISHLKHEGFTVSANLTRVSKVKPEELLDFALQVEQAGVDILFLADSNGALFPYQVSELYSCLFQNLNIELGFHPHNNLQFAATNALLAIDSGASIIDGSLFGLGKRLSNLHIETFAAMLYKLGYVKKSDLGVLFATSRNAYHNLIHQVTNDRYNYEQINALVGYHDLNYNKLNQLYEKSKQLNIDVLDILLNF